MSGPEAFHIDAAATLVLDAGATADTSVSFDGAVSTLRLGDGQNFHGAISHFAAGQAIDLRSVGYTGQAADYTAGAAGSGLLSVSDGTHAAALTLLGSYSANSFHLASDQHGGTLIGLVG